MFSRWPAIAVAALLPLLIVGCGGGGSGGGEQQGGASDESQMVTVQGSVDLGGVDPDETQLLLDGRPLDVEIDEDGNFVVPGIPEGEHVLQVVTRDGMRGGAVRFVARPGLHVRLEQPIDLEATGQIVGIVVKRDGDVEERVAGVEVVARSDLVWIQVPDGRRALRPRRAGASEDGDEASLIFPPPPDIEGNTYSAFTDEDGTYQIKGVEPGAYLVTCALAGYEPAQAWVYVEANRTAVADLVLVPAVEPGVATLTGTVSGRSSEGEVKPLEGAEVLVTLDTPWRPPRRGPRPIPVVGILPAHEHGEDVVEGPDVAFREFRTLTDANGHYTLNVPAGHATVLVWAEGYATAMKRTTLQAGATVVLDFVLDEIQWPPLPPDIEPTPESVQ